MKLFALIVAVTAGSALAACPNNCSRHGTCGSADLCTCHPRWTGADCSLRECPYGLSWTTEGDGVVPAGNGMGGLHPYTECSSKGTCDRTTGECQCYPGYEGRGCRRQACPNNCSGNGRCISNSEYNSEYVATAGAKFSSSTWDMEAARVCACDRGWEGYDCSSRICPKGDDPVTDCSTGGAAAANSLAHHMVQRLYVEVTQNESDDCNHITQASGTSYDSYKQQFEPDLTDSDFNQLTLGSVTPKHISDYGLLTTTTPTEFYAKRMDMSNQGKACMNLTGDGDSATIADTFVGTYYGYIALKYTDMFGGEYFTRPILIDVSDYAKQTYTDGSSGTTQPYGAIDRLYQYEASKEQFYAVSEAYIDSGNGQQSGDSLNGVTNAGTHEPIFNNRMLRTTLKRFTADRIRHALQDLPNFAVPSVNVTNYIKPGSTSDGDIWGNVFDITFTDDATAGKQPLLECVYDSARSCAGAQPKMANLDPFGPTINGLGASDKIRTVKSSPLLPQAGETTHVHYCGVFEVPLAAGKDYEENAECSNRGLCDGSTGICNCFEGHTGENCSTQTVFF